MGAAQCQFSTMQQILYICAIMGKQGNTSTGTHRDGCGVGFVGLTQARLQVADPCFDGVMLSHAAQNDNELITPYSGQERVRTGRFTNAVGGHQQYLIPYAKPQCIVDLSEPFEINHCHGKRGISCCIQGGMGLKQAFAVGKTSQWVCHSKAACRNFFTLACGHIGNGALHGAIAQG